MADVAEPPPSAASAPTPGASLPTKKATRNDHLVGPSGGASNEAVADALQAVQLTDAPPVAEQSSEAKEAGAPAGNEVMKERTEEAGRPEKYGVEPEQGLSSEENAEVLKNMRKAVAALGVDESTASDSALLRFLRARAMDIDKSSKLFVACEDWKKTFKPKGYISEDEIANEIAAEKSYMQGRDKQGHPLGYTLVKKHDAYKRDLDEFKRFLVYALDKLCAQAEANGCEKFVGILELKGIGYRCLDSGALRSIFDFLQGYYPERLAMLWFLNAPTIFWAVWKVVSPFIDKRTRAKVAFIDDKTLDQLTSHFEKDQLPEVLGGTLPLVPIDKAVVPGWPPTRDGSSAS